MPYPEAKILKLTRQSGSGNLAPHSKGHTFSGFAPAKRGAAQTCHIETPIFDLNAFGSTDPQPIVIAASI
jgi:hypothetical protein